MVCTQFKFTLALPCQCNQWVLCSFSHFRVSQTNSPSSFDYLDWLNPGLFNSGMKWWQYKYLRHSESCIYLKLEQVLYKKIMHDVNCFSKIPNLNRKERLGTYRAVLYAQGIYRMHRYNCVSLDKLWLPRWQTMIMAIWPHFVPVDHALGFCGSVLHPSTGVTVKIRDARSIT